MSDYIPHYYVTVDGKKFGPVPPEQVRDFSHLKGVVIEEVLVRPRGKVSKVERIAPEETLPLFGGES